MKVVALLLLAVTVSGAQTFFDDFEDNDISDWEERGNEASWSVSEGMVHGSTSVSVCELVPIDLQECTDVAVQVYARGVHDFGVCARYDQDDTGIVAYVSPDNNVARIRIVGNGTPGTIYNSIYEDFPSGVWYHLTLTCSGPYLILQIEAAGESWILSAIDPEPRSGVAGLHMAEEPGADWDWFSATMLTSVGTEETVVPPNSMLAAPNPFRELVVLDIVTSLDQGTVQVLDLAGRTVAMLPFRSRNGHAQVVWGGASEDSRVPAGVYIARIAGTEAAPLRLVRLQ